MDATKRILLTQGKFALVDNEDYDWLNQWKWSASEYRGQWCAVRGVMTNWVRKQIKMHRVIMGDPAGKEIDHRDGNGLNNQKSNLRACSHAQNIANQRKRSTNMSGFKGVSWASHAKKWRSQIGCKGKRHHVGYFSCIITAAKAYDKKARELFGEFANTNF